MSRRGARTMRRETGARRRLVICCAAGLLGPDVARAQAVDYGKLEDIFGEAITTSATGKPQRASEVPADMVIITQDEIRRSGADTIPDILQFVTGIDVRRYSFGDSQVAIRGYDQPLNPRLLVLVDGRQVYDDVDGDEPWNTIPVQLSEIRQIEIVKGPNSALFGFNAASGVINIITFDPLLDNTNVATLRGGTRGYAEGDAVVTQHFGATAGVRLSAGGWTSQDFSRSDNTTTVAPSYGSFNADGRWQATPWLSLNASGGYTDAQTQRELPDLLTEEARHVSYFRLGAAAKTSVGTVDVDIYRNYNSGTLFGTAFDNAILVGKISDLVKLDASNTVRVGFEYRSNYITSNPPVFAGRISDDDLAVNGMWNWQISPAFELTNAVRLDHLALNQSGGPLIVTPGRSQQDYDNTTLTEVSFNSGLVVHVSDLDIVRITAARGLQLPSLVDFGLQDRVAPGVYALGTPSVRPEAVWNAELGYTRSLQAIGASLETSVFFQRNTDIAAAGSSTPFAPLGGVFAAVTENFGSSNEIGFEIGLRASNASGFRWNASYRYASITQDTFSNVAAGQATRFDNGTPVHAIILGAGYTSGRWEMDVAGRFQSAFTDYARNGVGTVVPVDIPDYVILNARVAYKLTDYVTVAGVAQQFNVSPLLEAAGSYVDRRFIVSATIRY